MMSETPKMGQWISMVFPLIIFVIVFNVGSSRASPPVEEQEKDRSVAAFQSLISNLRKESTGNNGRLRFGKRKEDGRQLSRRAEQQQNFQNLISSLKAEANGNGRLRFGKRAGAAALDSLLNDLSTSAADSTGRLRLEIDFLFQVTQVIDFYFRFGKRAALTQDLLNSIQQSSNSGTGRLRFGRR